MKDVVYVTGNANKAKYFKALIGLEIEHAAVDIDEIQSLDQQDIAKAKAIEAFKVLQRPVLVEDTALSFEYLKRLPGTLIKWFLEELGQEGLCRLADADPRRLATASCTYAYYDGNTMTIFSGQGHGSIAESPVGTSGFGWNQLFIPVGCNQTLGQMDEATFKREYLKIKPIDEVREFLIS